MCEQQVIILCEGNLVLLGGDRVAAKLGHDGLHGLLVLFEQQTQLFVLLLEGMVLDDDLGVGTLELRLESFLGNVHIKPSQSRFGLQVSRVGLE